MKDKTQLKYPQGKKAVRISRSKYGTLKEALIGYLRKYRQGTFYEIAMATQQNFKTNKVDLEGALNWRLEWVKPDLEANNAVRWVPGTSPQKCEFVNCPRTDMMLPGITISRVAYVVLLTPVYFFMQTRKSSKTSHGSDRNPGCPTGRRVPDIILL